MSACKSGNTFNRMNEWLNSSLLAAMESTLTLRPHGTQECHVVRRQVRRASWQLLVRLGLTHTRCGEVRVAVALDQSIDYRRELHPGDLITIRSRVLEVIEKTLGMTHEMTNDQTGELAAVTVIVGFHMDA